MQGILRENVIYATVGQAERIKTLKPGTNVEIVDVIGKNVYKCKDEDGNKFTISGRKISVIS